MSLRTIERLALSVALGLSGICAFAQAPADVQTQHESHKLIRANDAVGSLGDDLFGDQVNLYTGALEFSVVDVSIPGNDDLPMQVARKFSVEATGGGPVVTGMFGDWDLDLPVIHGTFSVEKGFVAFDNSTQRCSEFGAPSGVTINSSLSFTAYEFWNGTSLYIPGVGDQEILERGANPLAPTGPPANYPLVTRDHWQIKCLSTLHVSNFKPGSTTEREPGEGFEVLSPTGIRYRFDWLTYRAVKGTTKVPSAGSQLLTPAPNAIARKEARLYPTLITDRFGNTVTLGWTGNQLNTMTASDGRVLTITYASNRISTVKEGLRTWIYTYDANNHLDTVERPDTYKWKYDLTPLFQAWIQYYSSGYCSPGTMAGTTFTGTITHPSGAVGTFTVVPTRHGRTHVPYGCPQGQGFLSEPNTFDTLALRNKQISVDGFSSINWLYQFSTAESCFVVDNQTPPSGLCGSSTLTPKTLTVTKSSTGEASKVDKFEFGTKYNFDEGKMLRHEQGDGSTALRIDVMEYGAPVGPQSVGNPANPRGDIYFATHIIPLRKNTTTINGGDLVREVSEWDNYGNPKKIKRFGPGYAKSETITYTPDETLWVLGLTSKVVDTSAPSPVEELVVTYDKGLPTTRIAFGRTDETRQYCGGSSLPAGCSASENGLLKIFLDGGNKATTFSNYKRGVPQTVKFEDNKSISGVVNNQGWVTSYTDELGNTTGYGYDLMGRLTGITQPGDTIAWAPTTISFVPVARVPGQNYELPNHWKQTTSTGNYRREVFFDQLWRPIMTREWDSALGGNRQTVRKFDSAGREIFTSYPLGSVSDYNQVTIGTRKTFDAIGRLQNVAVNAENGAFLNTTIGYPSAGTKTVLNPNGKTTTIKYMQLDDDNEELPTLIESQLADGSFVTTTIDRDVWGKPKSVKRSGGTPYSEATRSYVYDAQQRICKLIEPERGAELYHYDGSNNIDWTAKGMALPDIHACNTTSVPANAMIARSYDLRNRLTQINYPDSTLDEYRTYEADGALDTITRGTPATGDLKWSYDYNKRRLLTHEFVDIDTAVTGGASSFAYDYDNIGNVRAHSTLNGLYINFSPNALGQARIVEASTAETSMVFANQVTWFPNGALKSFKYGNGVTHTLTQNTRLLPSRSLDQKDANVPIVDRTITYDGNGNPTVIDDALNVDDKTMEYDNLDRLIGTTGVYRRADFAYDALDNLTQYKLDTRDWRYVIDGNKRLGSITNNGAAHMTFTHDARGNITRKVVGSTTNDFSFDMAERLHTVRRNNVTLANYRYDGHGRRVKATKPNGDQHFQAYTRAGEYQWDADFITNQETHTNHIYLAGSLIGKFVSTTSYSAGAASAATGSKAGGRPDVDPFLFRYDRKPGNGNGNNALTDSAKAATTVSEIIYIHTDALGSPVAESNTGGWKLPGTRIYEPYGNPLTTPRDAAPSYTGHAYDTSTGLIYAQQRYYDPTIGRFLSADPMPSDTSSASNFNRYAYANNNPYRFVDPDGREAKSNGDDSPKVDEDSLTRREKSEKREEIKLIKQGLRQAGKAMRKSNNTERLTRYLAMTVTISGKLPPEVEAAAIKQGMKPSDVMGYEQKPGDGNITFTPAMGYLGGKGYTPPYHGMIMGSGGPRTLFKGIVHEVGHEFVENWSSDPVTREKNANDVVRDLLPYFEE